MSLLQGKGVTIRFGSKLAVKEATFSVEQGRFTLFLGKSGSGKTSLLKAIAGLLPLYQGTIVQEESQRIGYVSQQCDLFPHMSALHNCVHPQICVLKRCTEEAQQRALELFDTLGIADLHDRFPTELSGGQRQKVAIARALAIESRVLLLDEPSSALDPESTKQLTSVLRGLLQEGVTIVVTTHDVQFARALLDRAYVMEDGAIVEHCTGKLSDFSTHLKRFFHE